MIEFENVTFRYPQQEAGQLRGINLSIPAGECLLFCGESGCGKTTITRLLNGLIPHFYAGELTGSVRINGENITQIPLYQLATQVGSVFQNPRTQFFNTDTDSEIAFGIENQALPTHELIQRVDQTTQALQIENLRQRNLLELSGGEKQKIAFASIYAMQPDIYLLDEPSSNLDTASIAQLTLQLKKLKSQGKTLIIAEHRLAYGLALIDRVVYLKAGEIAAIFTVAEFKKLSNEKRQEMGLRSLSLGDLAVAPVSLSKSQPTLEIKNMAVFQKQKELLNLPSLTLKQGEIVALVGNNGVGKTTFSRALCGLHKACQGEFLWAGVPKSSKQRRQFASLVMQDVNYQLFAESVEAECSFGIKKPNPEMLAETLDELALSSLKDRHPNTLSGGQKQRLAVAVSRICGKKWLVFDEPTSGLDYRSMLQVGKVLKKLAEQQAIIFVVTHDYEFILETCTRVLHFAQQQIVADFLLNEESLPKLKKIFTIQ